MSQKFEISVNKAQFDRLLESAAGQLAKDFAYVRWWWLADDTMIMDATTGLLWDAKPDISNEFGIANGQAQCVAKKIGGFTTWRLPTSDEFFVMSSVGTFPIHYQYLDKITIFKSYWWISSGGGIHVYDNKKHTGRNVGLLIATAPLLAKDVTLQNLLAVCVAKNWSVKPHAQNDNQMQSFYQHYVIVCAHVLKRPELLSASAIQAMYSHLDYCSVRLPKLDVLRFTDPHQGLWEFYAQTGATSDRQTLQLLHQVRARNPEDDIRDGYVAIDFGTSSTVVAFKEQGRDQLLRIGLADLYQTPQPKHYENPTVLEFIDIQKLLVDWQGQAYRPLVSWDSVHCSHEARASLRDNDTNPKVVGSVLERLKQWALRGSQHAVVSVTDQDHGKEYPLPPLTERNPVKGKPLTVSKDYPFDPIELYAWFLGMTINWRGRGLFMHYFMTFPVKYSAEVKSKILSSFRRGLQRSLPDALITSPHFQEFTVEERASEPAAFAASALQAYGIEPTEEGEAYAVFDFGGGTTDFDYGYYRLPTDTEAQRNAEHMLEHFSADGDEFLGGENLLENMAYQVFCDNLDVCRKKQIAFTRPLDADDFPGSEVLIVRTQAAITNTTMLMSKLRPLWEKGERNSTNALKIKLLDRHGVSVDCDFSVDEDKLLTYLQGRIRQGLLNFFIAMKQAFGERNSKSMPKQVHILLAGNACHSQIVQQMFGMGGRTTDTIQKGSGTLPVANDAFELTRQSWSEIFGENCPQFEVHPPLVSDPENPNKPNAKTGVALGLLHLCPGERLHVINHAVGENKESPFLYYVGGYVRGVFQVRLGRGSPYGGSWQELGMVGEHVFNLAYTQAANALLGTLRRGDMQLMERRLKFPAAADGDKVFARAQGPDSIELVTGTNVASVEAGKGQHQQVVALASK